MADRRQGSPPTNTREARLKAALKANVEQKSYQAAMIREAEANAVAASADVQKKWTQDPAGYNAKAQAAFASLLAK